jgi:hypothetical protein
MPSAKSMLSNKVDLLGWHVSVGVLVLLFTFIVCVLYLADAKKQVIDDAAVGTQELADGAVTYEKLALLPGLTAGAGFTSESEDFAFNSYSERTGDLIRTVLYVDLTGISCSAIAGDALGKTGEASANIGQYNEALMGKLFRGTMTCIEAPVGGLADIDLAGNTDGTVTTGNAANDAILIAAAADLTPGKTVNLAALPTADDYLYLVNGAAGTAGTYTAGQLLIELWGRAV